jgi:hypothetical protein
MIAPQNFAKPDTPSAPSIGLTLARAERHSGEAKEKNIAGMERCPQVSGLSLSGHKGGCE